VNPRNLVAHRAPSGRPPLALIGNDQEWSTRSIESIIAPKGFAVLRAYNGKEVVERARSAQPDALILDLRLPDRDGVEVCRQLRDEQLISPSTPIIMTSAAPPSKAQRLAALEAGAWEVLGHPIDADEMLLKLDAFVRAKYEADHAREEGLLDLSSGLYNVRGLARRAREVGADAFRRHNSLACVVIGIDPTPEAAGDAAGLAQALEQVGQALQSISRASDAVGRLGRSEFAVIAPGTSAEGAVRLAERVAEAVEQSADKRISSAFKLRAGYEAVADLHQTPVEPVDLLVRATSALRQSRADGDGTRFRRYDQAFANN
jgi:diguanylate cyclase (GGDEF)-like protein